MNTIREKLYELAAKWDRQRLSSIENPHPFSRMLDEILFHADLRYIDYIQFKDEDGEFPTRFLNWLGNVASDIDKRTLFQLALCLSFVDRAQMRSLYRDAYRRIIVPWLTTLGQFTAGDCFAADYESKLRLAFNQSLVLSITESFSFPDFRNVNSLAGLKKPRILGDRPNLAKAALKEISTEHKRIVVLEDFVGTGSQSKKILNRIIERFPKGQIIFIPLIILESGLVNCNLLSKAITVEPVLVVPVKNCLLRDFNQGELECFNSIRPLVKQLKARVTEKYSGLDDSCDDEFGFDGSGAILVTAHNTPNNTLPMIHHKAPTWNPLFRRLHHNY